MPSTHKCPIRDCNAQVPQSMLMCAAHWRKVPRPLQRKVYDEWQYGRPTAGHREACAAAIKAVSPPGIVAAITVAAGQGGKPCSLGCGKTVFFGIHPSTKNMHPVSINGALLADARPPGRDRAGVGVSHFLDCAVFLQQQAVLREQREKEKRIVAERDAWLQPELGL